MTPTPGAPHERPSDEAPGGAHELHRMDGETARIDTETHGVVDEREGDERQQDSEDKHRHPNLREVAVHGIDEVFLIRDIGYFGVFLQLLGDPHEGVVVGIVARERQFDGRREGVDAIGEGRRVGAHLLGGIFQCRLLTDEMDGLDVRPLGDAPHDGLCLVVGHVLF